MKLLIYNPEHDICLARDDGETAVPKAARHVRERYDHVPAYWADDGDMVVVGDTKSAAARLAADGRAHADVNFITLHDVTRLSETELPDEIVPWGWDKSVVRTLLKACPLLARLMPDAAQLAEIRRLSSRVFAAEEVLPRLRDSIGGTTGAMSVFTGTAEELAAMAATRRHAVLKSPWSSSGRGVRFVENTLTDNDFGWAANVLREQGAILVEPRYDKLLDFAMEFFVEKNYTVTYLGLSIFDTDGATYRRNIIAAEAEKTGIVGRYIPSATIAEARERLKEIASELFRNRYHGPFGVDMMAVNTAAGIALHPCVELNLRYTMGHAALLRDGQR